MNSLERLNAAAYRAAVSRPIIVCFEGLLGGLAGANQAGAGASGQYQQAANQGNKGYQAAENNLINATGSPAATTFGNEEVAALQPQFQKQDAQLAAADAASGITNSGAGNYNTQELAGDQSSAIAGSLAPLYSAALGEYGNLLSGQASGNEQLLGEGAGAFNQASENATNSLVSTGEDIGEAAAGLPPTASPYTQSSVSPYVNPTGINAAPGTNTATGGYVDSLDPQNYTSAPPNYNPYDSPYDYSTSNSPFSTSP